MEKSPATFSIGYETIWNVISIRGNFLLSNMNHWNWINNAQEVLSLVHLKKGHHLWSNWFTALREWGRILLHDSAYSLWSVIPGALTVELSDLFTIYFDRRDYEFTGVFSCSPLVAYNCHLSDSIWRQLCVTNVGNFRWNSLQLTPVTT